MHYGIVVLIDTPHPLTEATIQEAVEQALAPYHEDKWDWFQVGGRWTGHFDGYDADKDPANLETCELCGGTGDRATYRKEPREHQHETGCNGCLGTGQKQKWPTARGFRLTDCKPAYNLTDSDLDVYAIVAGDWHGGETYEPWRADGDKFVKQPKPPLDWIVKEHGDQLAVIVDCHN